MQYTNQRKEALKNFEGRSEISDDENVLEKLYKILNEDFEPFGKRLHTIMREKLGRDLGDLVVELKEVCKKTGVPIKDIASKTETIQHWFYGKTIKGTRKTTYPRPKKSDDSRSSMFAFAFAMELSDEETERLFHNAYLDRAFNFRDYRELIYYYCLRNGLSYEQAQSMISSVDLTCISVTTDKTILTRNIALDALQMDSADDLIEFIYKNGHNFSINAKSAKATMLKLKKEAKILSAKAYDSDREKHQKKKMEEIARRKNEGRWNREWREKLDCDEVFENSKGYKKQRESDRNLYITITDVSMGKIDGITTISLKGSELPKEISNNFPQVTSLNENTESFEELRKVIILLASYCFWEMRAGEDKFFNKYIIEVNGYLYDANLPELYYGNPYDWLFLLCTTTPSPLKNFQFILQQALQKDD